MNTLNYKKNNDTQNTNNNIFLDEYFVIEEK